MAVASAPITETGGPRDKAVVPAAARQTILVVDDREEDFELLRVMFKRSAILNPLKWVRSVYDALAYLKGHGEYANREMYPFPTLLLLDLHLQDGSGFDVLHSIQTLRMPSPIAVVVLTGSDVSAINRAYKLGAHSFLVKPLKFSEFENMVRHVRGIKLTSTSEGHLLEVDSF